MKILKFCVIFPSFAVQIVDTDEGTPYLTKKTKISQIQEISKFRRILREDFFETERKPFFPWSLLCQKYGTFLAPTRLLVISNSFRTSKARIKPNLERYLRKKRLYFRGVSKPTKANTETQKKDTIIF